MNPQRMVCHTVSKSDQRGVFRSLVRGSISFLKAAQLNKKQMLGTVPLKLFRALKPIPCLSRPD